MSSLAFPIKDLIRRRFQTTLTILGLTICVATTTFLVQFGNAIGFEIFLLAEGRLTTGFSYIFTVFTILASFLAFLVCLLITLFLVSMAMSQRVQDIGIMKATGCLTNIVFGYFATELFIMILLSCVLGTVFGISMYYASINVLNTSGFSLADTSLNISAVFVSFLAFMIAPSLIGGRIVAKWIRVKSTNALSPSLFLAMSSSGKSFVSSRLGTTLKMALRNLIRRKSVTIYSTLCLTSVLMLTTLTLAGGMIANQTTQNYVQRAIGKDIIVVGHQNMTAQYSKLLSQFFSPQQMQQFDYLDSKLLIPESNISKIRSIIGVVNIDSRFLIETTVYEIQKTVIVDPETSAYRQIGDSRSSQALVVGVNPESILSEWLINGRFLNETDSLSAVIGDSLASKVFEEPRLQSMKLFGESFGIVGVCLDTLNKGNVVYVPIKTMTNLVPNSGCNLLFLKIDPLKHDEVLSEIEKVANATGLSILELNSILNEHIVFLDRIWSLIMFLPLLSLATAALCLVAYMTLLITGQKRDFGIMRALGAKPKTVIKIVLMEILIVLAISASIGIFSGFLIALEFLIPNPIFSLNNFLSIAGWLASALVFLGLTSLYPALRMVKEPILKAIYYP
jgi:ABC-type antimicrobial peptide transport system permease subunit